MTWNPRLIELKSYGTRAMNNSDTNTYERYAKANIKVTLLSSCKPISTGCETAEPQIKFCA